MRLFIFPIPIFDDATTSIKMASIGESISMGLLPAT